MSESWYAPDDTPAPAGDEIWRAPHDPISEVPVAAPDYADLMRPAPPERERPITDVPDAAEGYLPPPVFEDGPTIEPVEAPPPVTAGPIDEVPYDAPVTVAAETTVIDDVPYDEPGTEPGAATPPLVAQVPLDVRTPPPEPAPEAEAQEARPTPWWRLF